MRVETSSLDGGSSPPATPPTAPDEAVVATAAASINDASASQKPTAAEPEGADAQVAAERGNSLPVGKPLAKHTVRGFMHDFLAQSRTIAARVRSACGLRRSVLAPPRCA